MADVDEEERPELPGERSRLGGSLCAGLPWMRDEIHVEPRGMLERPPRCRYPRQCAKERICIMAQAREEAAWSEYRIQHRLDLRAGRTTIESFEEWAGLAA